MSEKIIFLPGQLVSSNIKKLMEQVFDGDNYSEVDEFYFDFSHLNFIEPGGVTVLTNVLSWLLKKGKKVFFNRPDEKSITKKNRESLLYLEDCGFFELFGIENIFGGGRLRSTTTPLKNIKYSEFEQWLRMDFKYWLQRQTHRTVEFSNISVAVQEIFNNIQDHSEESIGCTFAQFYPKAQQICISLSDFGIGIPTSLKDKFPEIDKDSDLLEKAVEEGVSTQSTPRNRGAGLWNIIKSLTSSSIGTVYIASNYGNIKYSGEEVEDKYESNVFYPGTFFEIWIDTNNQSLYDDEEEEDFAWFI